MDFVGRDRAIQPIQKVSSMLTVLFVSCASSPSGTYTGSVDVIGATVSATISIVSSASLDFSVSGSVPQPITCKGEAYKCDGAGTITLPGMDAAGDCVHDALGSATISHIAYDKSIDQIIVSIGGQGLDLNVSLSHQMIGSPEAADSNATCTGCKLLVTALDLPVKEGNKSISELAHVVAEVCAHIPLLKVQREVCETIAGSISEVAKLIADGVPTSKICAKLGLCAAAAGMGHVDVVEGRVMQTESRV